MSIANGAGASGLARYKPLMEKGEISKQRYDAAANADATASALDQEELSQAQRNVE
jgi:hypothetical protein